MAEAALLYTICPSNTATNPNLSCQLLRYHLDTYGLFI
jgi:hypothetical protein